MFSLNIMSLVVITILCVLDENRQTLFLLLFFIIIYILDSSDFDNLTRLPWPTLDDCKQYKKVNLKMLYTTWVSVTAKSIRYVRIAQNCLITRSAILWSQKFDSTK